MPDEAFSTATVVTIPARSTWEKWLYFNADMFARHIGTAGMIWIGVSVKHQAAQWPDLWAYLLSGAIVPTFFTILAKGLPGMGDGATVTLNSGNGAPPMAAPPAPTKTTKIE